MKYRIFDFDDTLVKTDARIIVQKKNGKSIKLTSGQFAVYKKEPGDEIDLSQFQNVLFNPRVIPKYVRILLAIYRAGSADLIILTARGFTKPVAKFLKEIGIPSGVKIKALNSSDPGKKRDYIEKLIQKGAVDIEFWDDSQKNIAAVNQLKKKYPNVKLVTYRVPTPH